MESKEGFKIIKVFITQHWFDRGIIEADVEDMNQNGLIRYSHPNWHWQRKYYFRRGYELTMEDAIKAVKRLSHQRLKYYQKQINNLRENHPHLREL